MGWEEEVEAVVVVVPFTEEAGGVKVVVEVSTG
jgi:hypothetical protein